MKTCAKCKQEKDLSCFHRRSTAKDGLTSWCKECKSEAARQWHEKRRERVRERSKQWRERNPERARENNKRYREENSERVSELRRQWYEKNRERDRETSIKWHEENAERAKEYDRRKIASLADVYVKNLLVGRSGLSTKHIPPALVELKRAQLQLHRKLKEVAP